MLFVSRNGNYVDDRSPVALDVGLQQRTEEGYHIDSQGVDCDLSLFDLNDLVVFQLLQQPRKLLDCVQGVLEVVLVAQQGNDELGLLIDSFERDSLLETELLPKRGKSAPNEGLGHKSVGKSVAVVGQHEYLLELVTSTDREFEDVLLGLGGNSTQVADTVSDSDCGRSLGDSSHFVALLEDVFDELIDELDESVLAYSLPVHQQH